MTDSAMADQLRAAGWTVEPPVDLRAANEWVSRFAGFERLWDGTTARAAYVYPVDCQGRSLDVPRNCACNCACLPRWAYWSRLYATRGHLSEDGYAPTVMQAQALADTDLLEKLRQAREARLRGVTARPCAGKLALEAE